MARYKDEAVIAAFQPYLQPDERLINHAYGVKQPHLLVITGLVALAILPGVLAATLMTKYYLVGLTDRRVIVLKLKMTGRTPQAKEMTDYPLSALPPVTAKSGKLFTHIAIADEETPFKAKFHRLGMKENRRHSQEMAAALTGDPALLPG